MKIRSAVSILICTLILSFSLSMNSSSGSTIIKNEDNAERLSQLGLFAGGTSGFELDRRPTRAEAAVMLVRMIGMEDDVVSGYYSHPFSDVPVWADHYVGYLYENRLTSGISATEYGSKQFISLNQYVTFVLRALGYSDVKGDFISKDSLVKAGQINLLGSSEIEYYSTKGEFLRDDIIGITINALKTSLKDSDNSLLDKLIYIDRVVDERTAINAGFIENRQVAFADSVLENVIREMIRKKEGPIFASDIRNIVEIKAERMGITSLEGLQDCKRLKGLFIGFNKVSDLEPVKDLEYLTTVYINNNEIRDIDALGKLTNLKNLNMLNNRVTDIKPLASLTGLVFLAVGNNPVKDISPIADLTNIETLSLLDLGLNDIKPIEKLIKLRWLDLQCNNLCNISPLSSLKDLTYLTLTFNKISDIRPLSGLTRLKTLKLGLNPITDYSPVKGIYDQLEEKDFTAN